jgi:outer membrane immunogenic protein
MRRILASAAFTIAALSAHAADMAGPPPVLRGALPASDTSIDWSGFYFGGTGAYNSMSLNRDRSIGTVDELLQRLVRGSVVETGVNAMPLVERGSVRSSRIGLGGFVGYNMAIDEALVGVELDYTRAKFNSDVTGDRSGRVTSSTLPATTYDWTAQTRRESKITEFATVKARMGYAWGNFLPYVAGGVAIARASENRSAQISGTQYELLTCPPPAGCPTAYPMPIREGTRTDFKFGYAVAIGADMALSSNVFLRAELQHVRFPDIAGTTAQLNQAKVGAAVKF